MNTLMRLFMLAWLVSGVACAKKPEPAMDWKRLAEELEARRQ